MRGAGLPLSTPLSLGARDALAPWSTSAALTPRTDFAATD